MGVRAARHRRSETARFAARTGPPSFAIVGHFADKVAPREPSGGTPPGSNAPEYRWEYHLDRVGAKRLDRPGNAKSAFFLWSVTPRHSG